MSVGFFVLINTVISLHGLYLFCFSELSFDLDVYPCKIEVWETYNPGSVVRILACDTASGTDVDDGRVR